MGKLLGKDAILKAEDLPRETVPVDEWEADASVLVRGLMGDERDSYEQSLAKVRRVGKKTEITPTLDNIKARLCVIAIIDEEGNRVFTDVDAKALGQKSALVLNRIVDVIERLSGMTKEDLEELTGNLEDAQSDSLPSG